MEKKKAPKRRGPLGNTKRVPSSKYYVFTLFNYDKYDIQDLKELGSKNNNKFIFGKEVCPTTGSKHLQGYIEFSKKCRPTEIKGINKTIHWEKCKSDRFTNLEYCSKDGKYWSNMSLHCLLPDVNLTEDKLVPWQKEIIRMVKEKPDDRTIYWFWEDVGNTGKTEFAKYMHKHYEATVLDGNKKDILSLCAQRKTCGLYIFDIPRSLKNKISYQSLELVKNGFYFSGKYEASDTRRFRPHIICFANFKPDTSRLSADRWEIQMLPALPASASRLGAKRFRFADGIFPKEGEKEII